MKKFILSFFFLLCGNALMGMKPEKPDLYFLCNETQECCTCFDSVIQIRKRTPKGSVFALPCCYTFDKAKNAAVTIICNSCFTKLKSFDRPPTFAEEAATTEEGEFKPPYLCPISRHDLNEYKPVRLTDDNIVRGDQFNRSIEQPAVTKNDHWPLFRNSRTLALIVAGTATGYGLHLVSHMIFKAEDIDELEKCAQAAQESLLSLNFDLSNPVLSLSKQYDIPAMLKTIKDEPLRQQLEQAVSEFDVALEKTCSTIVSRYYYQTAEHFLEKEQELVTQLASAQAQLQALIVECKKQKQPDTVGFLKISCATGIAAACGYYWAKASPLKKWGLFS